MSENRIPTNKLKEIATTARKHCLSTRTIRYSNTSIRWPDCYDVSEKIIDELIKEFYDTHNIHCEIVEYIINAGYKHYAVELTNKDTGKQYLIDAAFTQFATEADTPIDIAPFEEINETIITKPEMYVFHSERTVR